MRPGTLAAVADAGGHHVTLTMAAYKAGCRGTKAGHLPLQIENQMYTPTNCLKQASNPTQTLTKYHNKKPRAHTGYIGAAYKSSFETLTCPCYNPRISTEKSPRMPPRNTNAILLYGRSLNLNPQPEPQTLGTQVNLPDTLSGLGFLNALS